MNIDIRHHKKYTRGMRLCIGILIATTALTACRDEFDIDQIGTKPKLVVYCFPSATSDTTWISVTNSVPVRKYTETRDIMNLTDAHVDYSVNGEQRKVSNISDYPLRKNQIIRGATFFVVGPHAAGDRVHIKVDCEGYDHVEAETIVPEQVPIRLERVVSVTEYDPVWYEKRNFHQLQATFTDPAETIDYYAVCVRCMLYNDHAYGVRPNEEGEEESVIYVDNEEKYKQMRQSYSDCIWHEEITDSLLIQPEVNNMDEPLLNPLTEMDSNFGFDSNFYDNFYIFSDEDINGKTYTLHLNIDAINVRNHSYLWSVPNYQVLLYRITPGYFRFLKSINDMDNNELAKGGFSQLMPTYSNISRGIGVLGGFNYTASNWKKLEQ